MSENKPYIRYVETADGSTTVKLEPAFWFMLEAICKAEKKTLNGLIQEVDGMHSDKFNRASALRVYAATYFMKQVTEDHGLWRGGRANSDRSISGKSA
jgi:predicted DNA-binding ribbon-helix-helix protein